MSLETLTQHAVNNTIWDILNVEPSKGDGHCFLYSTVQSFNSQKSPKELLDLNSLVTKIYEETERNASDYLPFIEGMSHANLIRELDRYINSKISNTDFCDLIPQIVANALPTRLIIMEQSKETNDMSVLELKCKQDTDECIVLFKKGLHYDAIVPRTLNVMPFSPVEMPTGDKHFGELKLCMWNMYGMSDLKMSNLQVYFKEFDVIFLLETWHDQLDVISLEGYEYLNYCRKNVHVNARRRSGGIGVLIKKDIRHYFSEKRKHEDVIIWFALNKNMMGRDKDIMIAAIYIPPDDSSHQLSVDPYHLLTLDVNDFMENNDVIICGDFNAYTNTTSDYTETTDGSNGPLNELCEGNSENNRAFKYLYNNGIVKRYSKDKKTLNHYGHLLIELCKTTELIICNGRIGDDRGIGEFTRVENNAKSVIDYLISSPNLIADITQFRVGKKVPESDHLPLEFSLKSGTKHISNIHDRKIPFTKYTKYRWSASDMEAFSIILSDDTSDTYYEAFLEQVSALESTNNVALSFNSYLKQAADRAFRKTNTGYKKRHGPQWFDKECFSARVAAVKAGERVLNVDGFQNMHSKTKEYRRIKQQKQRTFKYHIQDRIDTLCQQKNSNIWHELNKILKYASDVNAPNDNEFFELFKTQSTAPQADYFCHVYLEEAKHFLDRHDDGKCGVKFNNVLEHDMFNCNFTCEEIYKAIGMLKTGKTPGHDGIPAECIKICADNLVEGITYMFNCIIESKEFPEMWANGLRIPVPKPGNKQSAENYRGITVLPVMEKIFETVVNNRLVIINEVFDREDKKNGGFLKGSQTDDNVFILQGLVYKQLFLKKRLFICFVDFSKAFDIIDRHILFYKMISSGISGRVVDTIRDLYRKTTFKVKGKNGLSPSLCNKFGVNQGGTLSPSLFRKYLTDLGDYLSTHAGILLNDDEMIAHMLWADDLVLFSDSHIGMQKQLNGLMNFCRKNRMIVNEMKTKIMVFGKPMNTNLKLNGKVIEQVKQYKYLGIIFNAIKNIDSNMLGKNSANLVNKGNKSIYSLLKKTKCMGAIRPTTQLFLFDTYVKPILLYGVGIWGMAKESINSIEKVHLKYLKQMLGVKRTTNSDMVYGETGHMPLYVCAHTQMINYFMRLSNMTGQNCLVRKVFDEQCMKNDIGVNNWITCVKKLMYAYEIDDTKFMSKDCVKNRIKQAALKNWSERISDTTLYPAARTYIQFKRNPNLEPYLLNVKLGKYRKAISRLRMNSHLLEIEKGRHNKTPVNERICIKCDLDEIEDEIHFITKCQLFSNTRTIFYNQISGTNPDFIQFNDIDKYIYLNTTLDPQVQKWYGKFIYDCIQIRG